MILDRNRIDLPLLITTLLLVGLGAVMIYSASFVIAEEKFQGDSSFFLKRHLVRVALGIGVLILFANLDYRKMRKWSLLMMAIGILGLFILYIPGLGLEIRGATRTLKLWVFNIQPAEGMKVVMVLFLAHWLDKSQHVIQKFIPGLLPGLIVIGMTFILIALQPDFGTAIALGLTSAAMLFIGRARLTHLAGVAMFLAPFVCVKIYLSPHSWKRVMAYFERFFGDPAEKLVNIQGADYQLQQSLIGLGTGGFFGTGLGQGKQKYLFLPDSYTDFVFSVIGEELGFIGALFVMGLFLVLAWRGIHIAKHAPDAYGFFLSSGLTTMISLHVILNIGVVTGLLPTTGLPLPFMSYGGSWLLFCMMSIGILLNISRGASRQQRLRYD
ncbi:MAG TPA: putative lipid II flippase FtsW [Candidatus Latescibacteria bacterium]|nr:putative lipid II flippase FtsW [Candidatus Latescibacterota bacterium]